MLINDNYIIEFFSTSIKLGRINSNKVREKYIEKYPEIIEYLLSRFEDIDNYKDAIYEIFSSYKKLNEIEKIDNHDIDDDYIIEVFSDVNGNRNPNLLSKKWLSKHPNIYNYLLNRFQDTSDAAEAVYLIFHHMESVPLCPYCEKKIPFHGFYHNYCSVSCASKGTYDLRKENSLKRHGVEHPTQLESTKDKMKLTCAKKYGKEHYALTEEWKNRVNQTCQERYGTDYVLQNQEIREKGKETLIDIYGVDNAAKSKEIQEQIRHTNLERYGKECYALTEEWKEKTNLTCQERYGTNYYMQTAEYKERVKNTCQQEYGQDYYFLTNEFKEKSKEKCQQIYYTDFYLQSEDAKEKSKQYWIDKCGYPFALQSEEIRNTIYANLYSQESMQKRYNTMKQNNTFNSSKVEEDFCQYLADKFPGDFIHQYKSDLYPFNCDFYIKSLDLYVEILGSWTHGGKPYIEGDLDCQEQLGKWNAKAESSKYYKNAINTWVVRDVAKRNVARDKGLNYLEIYAYKVKDAIDIFEEYIWR